MTDALTLDGTTQPITEWALDYGIYPAVIIDRLARGWTPERAVTTPMMVAPRQRLAGEHLPGLPALKSATQRKPQRKSSCAPRRGRLIAHDGLTLTIPEWAERRSLNAVLIYKRLQNGWPVERALSPPSRLCRPGVV